MIPKSIAHAGSHLGYVVVRHFKAIYCNRSCFYDHLGSLVVFSELGINESGPFFAHLDVG